MVLVVEQVDGGHVAMDTAEVTGSTRVIIFILLVSREQWNLTNNKKEHLYCTCIG